MRNLLLTGQLTKSAPADEAARVQTLSTLRALDADRNRRVLQFLRDSQLIGTPDPIIDLRNANLINDDLSGANLTGINLNGAALTSADLSGANLDGATLYGADLGGADLSGAKLNNAFLFAARLNDADLRGATLMDATLTGALLGGTNMNSTVLTGAHLNGAILQGAHLNGAYLSGANLNGANLTDADLSGADVSDANLITAGLTPQQSGLTQQQLDEASICTNAILPQGLACQAICTFLDTVPMCQPRPVQLTYWYTENPAESHVIKELISQFEQQNHYMIRINAINTNYYQTQAAFENAEEEGNAPDVLRSDVGWVAQFASQGYLLNIDPYTPQDYLSDYMKGPLGYDRYPEGSLNLYGLPQVTDFLALLYNKKELMKAFNTTSLPSPPSTMHEFEMDAEKVAQRIPGTYGFETDGTSYNALPFLYAFGGGMLDQQNKIMVSSGGSVNGLGFLVNLQKLKSHNNDNVMPPNVNFVNAPPSPIVTDFITGKTAMIFGGPYDVKEILTGSSFQGGLGNLGIAPIPTGPAGQAGSPGGGQSYVISAGTTHPIEAYKFISFMSSLASQVEIAEANGTLPTRNRAYQDKNLKSSPFYPIISKFHCLAPMTVDRPANPEAAHLFDGFDPNIALALDGVESPTTALTAVANAWEQLGFTPAGREHPRAARSVPRC